MSQQCAHLSAVDPPIEKIDFLVLAAENKHQ